MAKSERISRLLYLTLATGLLLALPAVPANAGTCIIKFPDYTRWARLHDPGVSARAFCRRFGARFRNDTCTATRRWSRARCDDYRRREAAYVRRVDPSFRRWSVTYLPGARRNRRH